MAESEEELKSLWMKVKKESEKVGLKLNIRKSKIMASGLITSWQIDGEIMETVSDFILGGSKIAADVPLLSIFYAFLKPFGDFNILSSSYLNIFKTIVFFLDYTKNNLRKN